MNPKSDRVSIRDLARLAGVSRTTVSLALRDNTEISAVTRERIKALAKKYDYRSHPAVNALMQQVGRKRRVHDEEIIAFIRTGSTSEEKALGPLEMLEGAKQEAYRLGFRVEVFWAGYCGVDSERLARVLYQRGIRGVVWGPMPYPHPPLRFPWRQFAPIACTRSTDVTHLPAVIINHSKGMVLVLENLQQMGAGRIGVVLNETMERRQDYGWSLGVDLHRHCSGGRKVHVLMLEGAPTRRRLDAWIKARRLDALVMIPDIHSASSWLDGKIPRASLDVAFSELGQVGGLYQNMRFIGESAVRSLALRLYNGITGLPERVSHTILEGVFMDGVSLRPLGIA